MRTIIIIMLLWFVCAVGCSDGTQQTKHAQVAKYHKGQIIFVLGEVPGIVKDEPETTDGMFRYHITTRSSSGAQTTDSWLEYQLTDSRFNGEFTVARKDTVYREEIVSIRTNTLTDQQQWIDAEVRSTREEFLTLEQLFSAEANHSHSVSAQDVERLLQKLHTIHDSDMTHLAGELKAGRYPRN